MTGSIFSPQIRQRHPYTMSALHNSVNCVIIMKPLQRGQRIGILFSFRQISTGRHSLEPVESMR